MTNESIVVLSCVVVLRRDNRNRVRWGIVAAERRIANVARSSRNHVRGGVWASLVGSPALVSDGFERVGICPELLY